MLLFYILQTFKILVPRISYGRYVCIIDDRTL